MTTKKRIFDIIQIGNREDLPSRTFDIFITAVIITNIVITFMYTFSEFSKSSGILHLIEMLTILVFIIEYILRIITADYLYPNVSKGKAVGRFLISYDGIIDLLTILPFFFLSGFVVFRIMRVIRIFHLFRINGSSDTFVIIKKVLRTKSRALVSSVLIILILMFASSLCMYSAEHTAQPEVFKNAFSGIWWSMSTVLTIGYGDIYPVTLAGKIMACIISFLGVGAVAIPTGIISAGFVEQFTKEANKQTKFHDIKELGEISLSEGHPLCGLSIEAIHSSFDLRILVVFRGELTVMPTDSLITKPGDILVVESRQLKKGS